MEKAHNDQEVTDVEAVSRRIEARVNHTGIPIQVRGKILSVFWDERLLDPRNTPDTIEERFYL